MSDFHLRTLGRQEFAECVRKAMRTRGMKGWLRGYEQVFGWRPVVFTWGDYLKAKMKRA